MNKSILNYVLVLLILVGCKKSDTQDKTIVEENPNQQIAKNLDDYFSALSALKKFNGAVLIQKDNEILFHQSYTMDSTIATLQVNKNAQFDIHSISKLMAKACIVKLEKEQILQANDKVSKYIPDFPKGELITIQHLLDNQSGLPRELSTPYDHLIEQSPDSIIQLIKKEELLFTPGEETLYSNLGYEIVYYIISKVTQKPFVQYLQDEFFKDLDMKETGAHFYLAKDNLTNAVKNHVGDDGKISVVPNFEASDTNQAKIYSSLPDLLRFIDAVKEAPYRAALKNNNGNIGWSGGGDGILSHAEADLTANFEFAFFSNYDEISFGSIISDIKKIVTNQPFEIPKEINRKAVQVDKKILEKYVGKYDMAEFNHQEFEIRLENDSVAFYQNGKSGGMLLAENDSIFFGDPKDEDYFIFRENESGAYDLILKYKGIDIVGKKKK